MESYPLYPIRELLSSILPLMLMDATCTPYSAKREPRSPAERRHVEETVAAIRLRTRHHDPYEEWEKQARKDALVRVSQRCLALAGVPRLMM